MFPNYCDHILDIRDTCIYDISEYDKKKKKMYNMAIFSRNI